MSREIPLRAWRYTIAELDTEGVVIAPSESSAIRKLLRRLHLVRGNMRHTAKMLSEGTYYVQTLRRAGVEKELTIRLTPIPQGGE